MLIGIKIRSKGMPPEPKKGSGEFLLSGDEKKHRLR
jgi:hypothetical protein